MHGFNLKAGHPATSSLGRYAVIFLHGSGGSGEEIRMFLESMPVDARSGGTFSHLLKDRGIDLITPSAVPRAYTLAGGDMMQVWFDRAASALDNGFHERQEDTIGISRSMQSIVDTYITPLSDHYERIFLGGFSMGGGLALYLLSQPLHSKVCGVFSMGSYLLDHSGLFPRPGDSSLRTSVPVLMMHGANDGLIAPQWGRLTQQYLQLRSFKVHWQEYRGIDHTMGVDMLRDLIAWMDNILATAPPVEAIALASSIIGDAGPSGSSSSRGNASGAVHNHAPYTVLPHPDGAKHKYIIVYSVPTNMKRNLTTHPVLACGSEFHIQSHPDGVSCVAVTANPDETAVQIGRRLLNRIQAGGCEGANACPMM